MPRAASAWPNRGSRAPGKAAYRAWRAGTVWSSVRWRRNSSGTRSRSSANSIDMSTHLSEHMFAAQPPPYPPPKGEGKTQSALPSGRRPFIAQLEVLEAFRNQEGLTGGLLSRPGADRLVQFGPVADLAFVLAQGFDLQVDGLAYVDPDIGLVRTGQVDLLHVVRLQPFVEQLGKDKARVRAGDDRVQRRLARGTMVGMVDVALAAPASGGVGRNDDVRLGASNSAGDLAAQVERRLQRTVVVAEEEDVLDPKLQRRRSLLGVTDLGQPFGGHRRVAAATVAVGQNQIGDLPAFFRPAGHRAGRAKLGVIRMSHHYEDANQPVRRIHQAGVGIAVENS